MEVRIAHGPRRRVSRVLIFIALAVAGAGLGAERAAAAQRYAAPAGSGSACLSATPCSIVTAINASSANDEVIVGSGTYTPATQLVTSAGNVTIHGAPGLPPLIQSSALNGLVLTGNGNVVRDLRIAGSQTFTGLAMQGNSRAERVDVRTSALAACSSAFGALYRDSLCLSTGNGAAAVSLASNGTDLTRLRNVTAIATHPNSAALLVNSGNNTTNTLDGRNVIALGSPTDIRTMTTPTASSATVTLGFSNYDSVMTTGGGTSTITPPGSATNQTAPVIFVNPLGDDFHAAPGSPTVDAGVADSLTGSTALDGIARPQGPAFDIGAYETTSVPVGTPADTTPPQTKITKRPKRVTTSRVARFEFTSNEPGSTFKCRFEKGDYKPCTSPQKFKHLKNRRHRFSVFAIDPAGNADFGPARFQWRIHERLRRP